MDFVHFSIELINSLDCMNKINFLWHKNAKLNSVAKCNKKWTFCWNKKKTHPIHYLYNFLVFLWNRKKLTKKLFEMQNNLFNKNIIFKLNSKFSFLLYFPNKYIKAEGLYYVQLYSGHFFFLVSLRSLYFSQQYVYFFICQCLSFYLVNFLELYLHRFYLENLIIMMVYNDGFFL